MASVKIDLGFGEQAVLSERALSRILTAKHQRDAEEFLRRWPRTRSIQQERTYLQQLGLHAGYNPPGVNPSDASALLRSAVQGGRVTVAIERATKQFGGGAGTPQPTRGSGAITSSRQSFAEMAAGGSGSSAMLSDAASAPKTYSWMQSYDDVSADDLIKYLESVIDSTPGDAATTPDAESSTTPLGDAQPFGCSEDSPLENGQDVAARGVGEAEEAECHAKYELDMEQCQFARAMYGGDLRTYSLCTSRAFENYQACRGY
ncbi:hypothetical protein [Burkholderia pseudomallei]|uniref:hypothetical protein n=1 Tax=Burkholderia pseudomallei TaxID=28450 RepID=UPI00015E12C1|nr:hypothetical protein [Burkholderia pseudomallei]AIP71655.1 hypothetical protein DU27_1213 [Burkholderia pseudomallei]AJW92910.1 hypothetical protein BG92_140 [Burkholderia pseudomallei 406e]EDO86394.1 hypothetical protein BURPS406E_K0245 [Burkholderia pseudomallei 406e]OMR39789.1 hypothetical protein AQ725_21985 [Burkholderia pseudomallei]CAJ3956734.1 Uncharacterised protein [Burkholderia pseudomallei]